VRVHEVLGKRLGRFGMQLHPEKTRLIDFRPPAERVGARRTVNRRAVWTPTGIASSGIGRNRFRNVESLLDAGLRPAPESNQLKPIDP